jgi:AcrR family transcriptional regulator
VSNVATERRRAREKEERRDALLVAARKVFFDKGIHRATVDDVAQQAEVSKGTVYLYFETKESILAHLLLEDLESLVGQLEAAFAPQEIVAADERLHRLARAYLDFYRTNPDTFRLLMSFDRGHFQDAVSPDLYQRILTTSLRGLAWVVQAIRQGMDDGTFAPGDARQAANVAWAALNGVLVLLGHPLRSQMVAADLDSLYTAALDLVLKGLEP